MAAAANQRTSLVRALKRWRATGAINRGRHGTKPLNPALDRGLAEYYFVTVNNELHIGAMMLARSV